MWSEKWFFIVFFYLTSTQNEVLSDKLSDLNAAVESKIVISKSIGEQTINVGIRYKFYKIYEYEPYTNSVYGKIIHSSTLNKFYTSINCEFVAWTIDQLMTFVKRFPLFYNPKFLFKHGNIFERNFKKMVATLDIILQTTGRFINILLRFMNINKYDSSFDMLVLNSLLSLHLKINCIKTLRNCESDDNNSKIEEFSDDVIIRLLLDSINSIQHFMAMNCEFGTYYVNRQFYGYPSNNDSNKININKFLKDINLVTDLEPLDRCNIKQILLIDIIAWLNSMAKWKTIYGNILIKDVSERIQNTYDLDIIFWYNELIFKTIMKLLFSRILEYFKLRKQFSNILMDDIEMIYSSIMLSDFTNLPSGLIQCFTLILSKREHKYSQNDELVIRITNYLNLLHEIDLVTDLNVKPKEKINLHSNSRSNGDEHDDELYNKSDLKKIINQIIFIIKDFECFIRLYEFLLSQYNNTYYIPFMKNYVKIKLFMQNIILESNASKYENSDTELMAIKADLKNCQSYEKCLLTDEGCKYIKALYGLCFETIVALNTMVCENIYEEKHIYYNEAKDIFTYIKVYLMNFFNTSYWDRPIFTMIYNVIPIFENIMRRFKQISYEIFVEDPYYEILRLMNVIMTVFNEYGLKFCSNPSKYNYLLFNNINFNMIGRPMMWIPADIEQSLNKMKEQSYTRFAVHEFSKLEHFYNEYYIINSTYAAIYKNIILLKWKGERLDIVEIHKYIFNAVLSPFYWYAINDLYLKFYIAVMFYEINELYKVNDVIKSKSECETFFSKIKTMILGNKFPQHLNKIIVNFYKLIKFLRVNICDEKSKNKKRENNKEKEMEENKISIIRKKINNQLTDNGIFVDSRQSKLIVNAQEVSEKIHKLNKSLQLANPDKYEVINTMQNPFEGFLYTLHKIFNLVERIIYYLDIITTIKTSQGISINIITFLFF